MLHKIPLFKFEQMFYNVFRNRQKGGRGMSAIREKGRCIDVICQHKTDGTIIPLKIRLQDDDGFYQTYGVRGYKDLTHYTERASQNGASSANHKWIFVCKIAVFDREKTVQLFYNAYDNRWILTEC